MQKTVTNNAFRTILMTIGSYRIKSGLVSIDTSYYLSRIQIFSKKSSQLALQPHMKNSPKFIRIIFWILASLGACLLKAGSSIATPGKLLLEENFDGPSLPKLFQVGVGDWQIIENTLRGRQLEKDNHTAFRKIFLDHQDVIYQFDMKIEGPAFSQILINYDLVHIAKCVAKRDQIGIYKIGEERKRVRMASEKRDQGLDPLNGDWKEKTHALDKKIQSLEEGKWYRVSIELLGDQIVMRINGQSLHGSHVGLTEKKTNFGFQAGGLEGYIYYDNIRVWEALPKK